jgi:hypothetical protein
MGKRSFALPVFGRSPSSGFFDATIALIWAVTDQYFSKIQSPPLGCAAAFDLIRLEEFDCAPDPLALKPTGNSPWSSSIWC